MKFIDKALELEPRSPLFNSNKSMLLSFIGDTGHERATPAEKEQLKCLTEEERNEKLAPFFAEAAKTCDHRPEFIRIGYYVNNSYTDQELEETPPERPIVEKLQREILAEKPRVTRFPILWE